MSADGLAYGTSRSDALAAFKAGLPSLLPRSNRWKSAVEAHRWGYHGEGSAAMADSCPACAASARTSGAES